MVSARRAAWLGLALFATAFGVLEVLNHGPAALAMVLGFLIAPAARGPLGPAWRAGATAFRGAP